MLKTNSQVLFQKLGEEAVLLHLDTEEYFGLNEVGATIWEVLEGGGSKEDALAAVMAEFEVDEATASTDIDTFIKNMKAENLLHEA